MSGGECRETKKKNILHLKELLNSSQKSCQNSAKIHDSNESSMKIISVKFHQSSKSIQISELQIKFHQIRWFMTYRINFESQILALWNLPTTQILKIQ